MFPTSTIQAVVCTVVIDILTIILYCGHYPILSQFKVREPSSPPTTTGNLSVGVGKFYFLFYCEAQINRSFASSV